MKRWFVCLAILWWSPAAAQLTDIENLPGAPFYSVTASGDALFAGAEGFVYVSVDGGRTWEQSGRIHEDVRSVDALHVASHGWYVGAFEQGVFRTIDEGETWTRINTGLQGIGALSVTSLVGSGGRVYASTDGAGVFIMDTDVAFSWSPYGSEFAFNEAETVSDLAMEGNLLLAAAGGNGLVFHRDINAGGWVPVQLTGHIIKAAFTPAGMIAAQQRRVFRSTDNGLNWQSSDFLTQSTSYIAVARVFGQAPGAERDVHVAVTCGGELSCLYRITWPDGAWHFLGTAPEVLDLVRVDDRLLLGQYDGLRWWTLGEGTGTGAEPQVPGHVTLRADAPYPNPTGGDTRLVVHIPMPAPVEIHLYDVTGREVGRSSAGFLPAGRHELSLPTGALAVGLYAVHVRTPHSRQVRLLTVAVE